MKVRIDALASAGQAEIAEIIIGTQEYNMFYKLTVEPDGGQKLMGKGEAASIALAKENNGIVASNNLRDIGV